MILFNHMKLAEKLGRGEISETVKFIYYLISFMLFTFITTNYLGVSIYGDLNLNNFDYLSDIIWVSISVLATILSFYINSKGNNRDFIARAICIGLPIAIQVFILVVVCIIALVAIELTMSGIFLNNFSEWPNSNDSGQIDLGIGVFIAIYYYTQYLRGISRAAQQ